MIRRLWPLLLIGLAACRRLPPDQANLLKAQKAYEQDHYRAAMAYARPLAETGNPAAQMLLAKMYAYGQGVPFDGGKAELLRNLAALRLAARGLQPDQRFAEDPIMKALTSTLRDVDDLGTRQESAIKTLSALNPVELEKLADQMQSQLTEALGPMPETPSAVSEEPSAAPSVDVPVTAVRSSPQPLSPEPAVAAAATPEAHRADSLSLALLRRGADRKDPLAMEMLSTAYARGFYGLAQNPARAAQWRQRAREARQDRQAGRSEEEDPQEGMPWKRFAPIAGCGAVLMGMGVWQARRLHIAPK